MVVMMDISLMDNQDNNEDLPKYDTLEQFVENGNVQNIYSISINHNNTSISNV